MLEQTEKRERGRPRSAETDEMILDAAWQILSSEGYEGLSFQAIAQRAGCSRSALYRRYLNKEELLVEILHLASRAVEPVLVEGASPRDALIAHSRAGRDYFCEKGTGLVNLSQVALRNEQLRKILDRNMANEVRYYLEPLRELAGDDCPDEIVQLAFDTIFSTIYMKSCFALSKPTDADVIRIVDAGISMLKCPAMTQV